MVTPYNPFSDLEGKTIYATGQGSTLNMSSIIFYKKTTLKMLTVEYMTEHAELAAALLAGDVNIALLPEPNVTAVLLKTIPYVKHLI